MSGSWVGASVRARLLARRRVGGGRALELAGCAGLPAALDALAGTPYGRDAGAGQTLAEAQRAVARTALWHLRIMAGWLPPSGAELARPLVGWFEIVNIEQRLAELDGGVAPAPFELGRLTAGWPEIAGAASGPALRAAVAASRWGDPGSAAADLLGPVLRLRWASWVGTQLPGAETWAAAAVVLLAARLLFAARAEPAQLAGLRAYGLRSGWWLAPSAAELAGFTIPSAAWALDGVTEPADLWRAEARWWGRVEADATRLTVRSAPGPEVIVAAAALLAHDAWLVRGALAVAARGTVARGAFNALV